MNNSRILIVFVAALLLACHAEASTHDVIREWNAIAVDRTLAAPAPAPAAQTRLMAIYSAAVHDAVNGITGRYQTYLTPGPAPNGSSPEAAAIAASYRALCGLFGTTYCTSIEPIFMLSLSNHGLSTDDPGIAYGLHAAESVLESRLDDGASIATFSWNGPSELPGTFRLNAGQSALLPGWGAVTPFVLRSSSQFRPEAPPALDSEIYAKDYNEVKEVGSTTSACSDSNPPPCRTAQQLDIALFWRDGSPVRVWNQPLQKFLASGDFDISSSARTNALVFLAAADSSIACWEAKYGNAVSGGYNFWRPQAAIRRGDEDANFATVGDPTWTPVHTTPAHPEYPSGHTSNSTAIATILQLTFGDRPGEPFTSSVTVNPTSPNPRVIVRTWSSFSEASDEVIDARVWSGIHFRNTDEVGSRLGRQVARFVWTHALQECKGYGMCR